LRTFILLGLAAVASAVYNYAPVRTSGTAAKASPVAPVPIPPSNVNHNITIVIIGKDLPSKTLDTIDPYIKVYETSKIINEPKKIGQTEVIDNQPNPEFATALTFSWTRGTNQTLLFKLKDSDRLRDNDIGTVSLSADQFAANGFKANLNLSSGGTILVQKTEPVKFKLYGRNFPRLDPGLTGTGKSDAYVKVYWRRGAKGEERQFHKTPIINDIENPDWPEVIEFPNYIKGNDLWLSFKVLDSDGVNKDDKIGDALLELDPFVEKRQTKILSLGKDTKATLGVTPAT